MLKERTLPYTTGDDIGPNHNYYAASTALGSFANVVKFGWDKSAGVALHRQYGMERAATPFSIIEGAPGKEIFRSSERKRPYFNTCTHKKKGGQNLPFTCAYYNKNGAPYGLYFWRLGAGNALPCDNLVRHFPVDLSTAQRSAWGIMQPRFEGNISMFNFIYELKDFRSLARFLLNKPLRKLSNMFKRLRRKPQFDPTLPLSRLHLANEFALKPLISDIVRITCQIEELISSVQQDFADAGRERSSRHYSQSFDVKNDDIRTAYYIARNPHLFVGQSEQLKFTATMEYSYEYNMRSTISAFVKYWGIQPSQEAIWNAIPGSFLVDYFLKVGKALAINSRDKNVLLELHQYCESLLSERTDGIHFTGSHLAGPLNLGSHERSGDGKHLVSGYFATLYTRNITRPKTGPVMPQLARPTTKQGWNMLALLRNFF